MQSDSTPEVPYGYCQCGCGRKTTIAPQTDRNRGRIKGEPGRFVVGHARRITGTLYVERDCGYVTPCWVWQLHKTGGGYGHYCVAGKMVYAHRWMYERHVGPVPDGKELDHLCRNRACVNPDHLEPVTKRTNILRGMSFAAVNAQKTHCIRGHEFTPENTYITPGGSRDCRMCQRLAYKKRREWERAERVGNGH